MDIAEAPVDAPVEHVESGSLSSHEAAYAPGRTRDEEPDEKPQQTVKDAPVAAKSEETTQTPDRKLKASDAASRIAELTRKHRDEERKTQALQRELDQLRSARPAAASLPPSGAVAASSSTAPVAAGRPKLEDYASHEDPYGAYLKADAKWEIREELRQEREAENAAKQQRDSAREGDEKISLFGQKVQDFIEDHADYIEKVEAIRDEKPPDLLLAALIGADNGPELLYALAQNDALRMELHLVTEDKAVTPSSVATVQRLLKSRIAAANTGSARPIPTIKPAPRPPNPVRTGPLNTGDELPGDDSSLAQHERAYGPKRRR